jgi:hypothetical protein
MEALADSPFAILTAIVAPAILTNACSVLALGTSNRIARVVDRTRAINTDFAKGQLSQHQAASYRRQLAILKDRSRLLMRALRLIYAALGLFASSALITVLGSALAYYNQTLGFLVAAACGLGAGILAVACLAAGSSMMVRETRLALEQMGEEIGAAEPSQPF